MSARIACPASECADRIERGASYSEDKSKFCDHWDRHAHTHCPGTFVMIDMDGHSTLTCRCYCHNRAAAGSTEEKKP